MTTAINYLDKIRFKTLMKALKTYIKQHEKGKFPSRKKDLL